MKKLLILLIITSLIAGAAGGCARNNNGSQSNSYDLQIKGSDTMVNLTQVWAEEFIKQNPGTNIAVTGGGSGTGLAALVSGSCQLAQSSRLIDEQELKMAEENGIKPVMHEVAMDGIAVIVNPKNPISGLTLDELRDIFMRNIRNWKEAGGDNLEIVILSREVNSGTHVFFKEKVLKRGDRKSDAEFASEALLMPSSQAIADEVRQNPNAVGYFGVGYTSAEVKTVAVSAAKSRKYYLPTEKNISSGAYPVSRPLYLYTNGEPKGITKQFLDFVLSGKGQEIVRKLDFVPVRRKV